MDMLLILLILNPAGTRIDVKHLGTYHSVNACVKAAAEAEEENQFKSKFVRFVCAPKLDI